MSLKNKAKEVHLRNECVNALFLSTRLGTNVYVYDKCRIDVCKRMNVSVYGDKYGCVLLKDGRIGTASVVENSVFMKKSDFNAVEDKYGKYVCDSNKQSYSNICERLKNK